MMVVSFEFASIGVEFCLAVMIVDEIAELRLGTILLYRLLTGAGVCGSYSRCELLGSRKSSSHMFIVQAIILEYFIWYLEYFIWYLEYVIWNW